MLHYVNGYIQQISCHKVQKAKNHPEPLIAQRELTIFDILVSFIFLFFFLEILVATLATTGTETRV